MSISRLCLAMAWLALWSIPAPAADLTTIDRTIAKEPAYQSKPKYCLLVFGPEAKARFWIVLDGETLYVDRNANSDLTEAGESATVAEREDRGICFNVPDLTEPDGKTKHTQFYLRLAPKGYVYIRVRVEGQRFWWAGFNDQERFSFAERPGEAPIIHFNGPRTFGSFLPKTLDRGPESDVIKRNYLSIGTPGLGTGTFAALDATQVPRPRRLVVESEFPNSTEGGKPIKSRQEFNFTA